MVDQFQDEGKLTQAGGTPTQEEGKPTLTEGTPTQEEGKPTPAEEKKPALTLVIQSWWTPALTVLALVIGLLLGYFGRPLVNKGTETTEDVAAVTPAVTAPAATVAAGQAAAPTTTVDPTMAAINSQEQLMAFLVSNTTQFIGDPNAPVTIIEFSDFQ